MAEVLSPHAVVVPVDEKVTKSIVDLLVGVLPAAQKPLTREPNPLHLLLPVSYTHLTLPTKRIV